MNDVSLPDTNILYKLIMEQESRHFSMQQACDDYELVRLKRSGQQIF